MAETKNVFLGAKMNKDLDPRLVSNREYIEARNASVTDSAGGDSGVLENVLGNIELTNFGLSDTNLKIIGFYVDTTNDRLFAFLTNYTDSSATSLTNPAPAASGHYIAVYNTISNDYTVLVGGSFLNFSDTHEVLGIDLIENLLFFTDNRNQPRKINVNLASANPYGSANPYYTSEDHISVAKYYPCLSPDITTLTGNGDLFGNSVLQIQTNSTMSNILRGIQTFTVGVSGVTTSGSGAGALSFNLTAISTGLAGQFFLSAGIIKSELKTGTGVTSSITTNPTNKNVATTTGVTQSATTGIGTGLTVTITTAGGVGVSTVTSVDVTSAGSGYSSGDEVTFAAASFGGGVGSDLIITLQTSDFVTSSGTGYQPGDTITIPGSTLANSTSGFGNTLGFAFTDAVFVVSRDNMARTPSMWDVTSTDLPDGATSNPYYDATFTGDEQFLSDKFVRFSYRFKFEDNEYSLIAPFSQAAFIPKQDGYFLEDSIPTSILDDAANSDEVDTIKSTIVEFFENKVNKVDISIPMPDGVTLGNATTNLYDKYKVTAIDVLYKESDGTTIRVIETITFDELETATGIDYVYSYDSSKPIKSLPSKETIRVSDRVPLRAKAQAVAGNRVMYGNLTLRSASLDSLNYTVTAGDKVAYGTDSSTSQREYPNHTLKQNRTYQVGVVLSDKYGRQSDVILSPNSTVFHPYKTAVMDLDYLGDSLQVLFNAPIPTNSSNIGYAGLYNETTNPLGWYSYKFVVKQQEQSYYNVYLPTILNGYPQKITGAAAYNTFTDEAHITLFSDNINKVPRDLQEVGPQDVQFSSSVRLFGRVYNTTFSSTAATNEQYFPGNIGDEVTLIGDRDEIGLDRTDEGEEYYSSPFYSIPTDGTGTGPGDGAALKGANPYIGRVSTVNLIGAVGGGDLTVVGTTPPEVTNLETRLNVYETAPTVSNLDIFWESSTSGLISDLNTSVEQNFSVLPVKLTNFEWNLSEDITPPVMGLAPVKAAQFDLASAGGSLINNSSTTAELIEVRDGNGGIVTNKFTLSKDSGGTNKFYITTSTGTYFTYTQFSPIKDNYTFTIKADNPFSGGGTSLISTGYGNYLANVVPGTGTVTGSNPLPEIRPPSTWSTFAVLDGDNGSADTSNEKTGLVWEVTKIEFLWVGNGSVWTEYQTPATDMFRVIKGSGQSVAETLQYNNQLICLDVNATNVTALYTYQNRTSTSVRVTLKLTDASGTGLSDTITYDMPPIVINRTD